MLYQNRRKVIKIVEKQITVNDQELILTCKNTLFTYKGFSVNQM